MAVVQVRWLSTMSTLNVGGSLESTTSRKVAQLFRKKNGMHHFTYKSFSGKCHAEIFGANVSLLAKNTVFFGG